MRLPYRKPGKYTNLETDVYITAEKLQELITQFDTLKKVTHPFLASEVSRLAELGDFSENQEYQLAKGRLRGTIEKMQKLEYHIAHAIIISKSQQTTIVRVGNTVTLVCDTTQKTYHILGTSETNPKKNVISHNSPLGAALMGRKVGDTFSLTLANKQVACTILEIS